MATTKRPKPWLETLRLALREFVPEDLDDLHRLDSDPRVMHFFGGKPAKREASEAAMRRILRYPRFYPDLGIWYATRRDTGEYIGWFCFKYAGRSADVEVGYRLLHRAWGKGFATEGATALVHYGFDDLGLHKIIGVTHPQNFASQRVLMKAGLLDVGWGRYYNERLRMFAATNGEA
ncbi:MAG: GNAT family N-acetyltransferase [Betaproteobacteria bacterium]